MQAIKNALAIAIMVAGVLLVSQITSIHAGGLYVTEPGHPAMGASGAGAGTLAEDRAVQQLDLPVVGQIHAERNAEAGAAVDLYFADQRCDDIVELAGGPGRDERCDFERHGADRSGAADNGEQRAEDGTCEHGSSP